MIGNTFRAGALLFTTLAIPVAVFAAPLPASAATGQLCETYDPTSYCLGSANLSREAQAVPSGYTVTVASPSTWDSIPSARIRPPNPCGTDRGHLA